MQIKKITVIFLSMYSCYSFSAGNSDNTTDLENIKNCIGFYKTAGDIAYDSNDRDKSGVAYTTMQAYRSAAEKLGGDGKYIKYEEKFMQYAKQGNTDAIKSTRATCSQLNNSHPVVMQEFSKINKK